MKKQLLTQAICLSVFAFITLSVGCAKPQIQVPTVAQIEISEDHWDFGTAILGSEVKHTFILKNTGGSDLIFYPYPNCPACIYIDVERYTIAPKSELKMNVKVVETQEGPYEGFITIDSNDLARPQIKITVKGTFIKSRKYY
jgi:hypothetical protein